MSETNSPTHVGTRIAGRYLCLEPLGSGGMGQVYLVADELEHGRRLALKLLRPDTFKPEWTELLKTEFAALARLHHPGLVEVYELAIDPASGMPFFTLERLTGTGILEAPAARELQGLVELIAQILKTLAFLHTEGYLHYDLKPGNIFVTDKGQAKLMDLALSGSPGRSALHKGTPAYAAPEMIRFEPVDRRLDLYSLGATLYHVLGGRPPFTGPLTEVLRGHLYRLPPPLCLPPEWAFLERFVLRLMAKRPEDRYFSAEQALAELSQHSSRVIGRPVSSDSYLLTSKIIGREVELQTLKRPLEALEAGTPAEDRSVLVLISGDSGLGKSRLLRELEVEAQLRGFSVASGHCVPRGLLPLQALREALRQPVLDAAARFPELLEAHRSELVRLLPGVGQGTAGTEDRAPHDSHTLAERLSQFLMLYAEHQRLVLHLGDLQWADEATVEVLELLTRHLQKEQARSRLVVYASFRPAESVGQPWGEAVARLAGGAGVVLLELQPLGGASVARMLDSMLGSAGLDEGLVEKVAAMTHGNPLFVEETVRYLLDWGLLLPKGGRFELLGQLEELPLPQSVPQALSMAFEGLDQDEIDLVQALAVIGRPAESSMLASVLERSVQRVRQSARLLLPKHFLSRNWTETDYLFALRHDQFSHYLYERLSPVAKARLHARVAEVLEAQLDPKADAAALIELAVHFSEGTGARGSDQGYRERAFRRCVQASTLAAHLVSYARAAELLGRAQRLAIRGGEPYLQQLVDVTVALILVLDTLSDDERKKKELARVERLVHLLQTAAA